MIRLKLTDKSAKKYAVRFKSIGAPSIVLNSNIKRGSD